MSQVPDAWDDEWPTSADQPTQSTQSEPKKLTTKQTKAQKRAAQAEFNRQLWAEAEGPQETNYFLESRNVVPHRQEFKAAPVLLSRKGPITRKARPLTEGLEDLKLKDREESSEDEDDAAAQQKALDEAKAQAARDREEKQRKYEERRMELFGPQSGSNSQAGVPTNRSGGSSPANNTPSNSRPSTPHRGGKRGRGRGNANGNSQPRAQQQVYQQQQQQLRELYDPGYIAKPTSNFLMRREQSGSPSMRDTAPIREPRAPDGSGVNGAGFVQRTDRLAQ